jgi:metal-responsive CopG/Arc/MetJ family transcriptional regulator
MAKKAETVMVSFRLDRALLREIDRGSKIEGRTRTSMIAAVLRSWVDTRKMMEGFSPKAIASMRNRERRTLDGGRHA